MASSKIFLESSILVTLVLVLTHRPAEGAQRDLLSLFANRVHQYKQPIIVILGKEDLVRKDRDHIMEKTYSAETSGEAVHKVHHMLGHDQQQISPLQYKESTLRPYRLEERKKQRFISQRFKEERALWNQDKAVLRSPIVKKLLRISNSLRCEAKDECQDKCSMQFKGRKEKKCIIQCEIKYECDEKEEKGEEDPCEDGDQDSCNGSVERIMSTRGVTLTTGKSKDCVRC